MSKKSEAWREYREAAMVDMLLETLPKVSTAKKIVFNFFEFDFKFSFLKFLRLLLKLPHLCHKQRKLQWYQAEVVKLVQLN